MDFQSIAIDLLLIGIPVLFVFLKLKKKKITIDFIRKELFLNWNGAKKTLISIITIAISLLIAMTLVLLLFQSIGFDDTANVGKTIQQIFQEQPWFLIYLFIARITAEEVFFRGFLISKIESASKILSKKTRPAYYSTMRKHGWKIGIISSAIIFGLAHFSYSSTVQIIGSIIGGIILGYFFKKNNSIIPNVFAHIIYNAIIISSILSGY